MELQGFVQGLQADLEQIAAVGNDDVAEAARRLSAAVGASAGLRLLDALTEAALELNAQLPSGHVEIRVAGQDPSLVYVAEAAEASPVGGGDEELVARISLRLPQGLKAAIELAASREGVSVNTWLVRALGRLISAGVSERRGPGNRLSGFARG
jgi:hypothetical protein